MIRKFKLWRHWWNVKKGVKTLDFKRGCGYYLPVGLFGVDIIGRIEDMMMESGRIGVFELVDYSTYRDPWDMVEYSWWHFIGYKDEKPIRDCTFREYLSVYQRKD